MRPTRDFKVEVYYSYRRQKTCCGMIVTASSEEGAGEEARTSILQHYPAAKIHMTVVTDDGSQP